MKKWIGIALAMVLSIALFIGVGAFSVSADASEYTYMTFGEQAVITDVSATLSGKITIPSSLGGKTVTRIESYAFQDSTTLTEVVIPNGVTSIGSFAFARCTGLTSVTIPASVTGIEEGAFEDCTALATVKFNAENCETMGFFDSRFTTYYPVFPGCTALKTVTIGPSVKTIPAYAFYECDGIKKITIPNAVTTIGKYAFYSCSGLTEVTIGSGVTDMSESVFERCENLKTVTFVNGVKTIPAYTFYECKNLSTVTIPKSITRVDIDAFYGCAALSKVVYGAKKAQSEAVTIAKGNDTLKKATWQYTNCNGALNHTYTNACDKTCNVCKESRTTSHSYQKVVTKATLTANGKIVNKCKVCGYTASTTTTVYRPTSFKLSATSYTYNGAVKKPTVTVKDSAGKTISSSNYTVTYASGRKNVGTYTVKVTMKGNYSGTKTLSFKINPINISKCKLSLSATTYTYDGKVKAPTVTVKNASGTKLTTSSYTATYASGRKNVGTYKVTVKMKGNYTGTKTLTFKINPAKTTVSKLTPATKSLKVAITKKTTQVTGYQVQYSTSKSFKSVKTVNISSYKTTSTTIKSLKAKTTYYVRVRTYKTVNGTKYYSGWSTVKSAKTK